jgi:hypothetical protein
MTNHRPAPPPPWHPLPLTELVVLLAVGCAGGAVLTFGSSRAFWFGGAALALGLLAGLEVAVREHFSGHRSHAAALGGTLGCTLSLGAFLAAGSPIEIASVSFGGFVLAAAALHWQFRRHRGRMEGGESDDAERLGTETGASATTGSGAGRRCVSRVPSDRA